ncbi:RNA ligase [Pseudomonas phage phiPsa397]|uniref:RNA ligase n=1 Tax=Pseudomonas phage phiPsa397 TaxID=1460367 RepID=A0A7G9V391_9CAUD|nr:RNA ligase [Pseudomonas phage phiPsa397]QNO00747.1 RNA ligase [Pseudomonas phage phiPsa397]
MFDALIEAGLVKRKRYENGLSVFKYARKVFYDALWNTDPLLLEARGIVLDDEGNKVIWPFTKVFNHNENGAGAELRADTQIIAPRKVNGFMAACRYWNGELIVSTTGSLDSDFAVLARQHIEKLIYNDMDAELTYLFEICDPSDPHIVEEVPGAWLIGARSMNTGTMMTEEWLDQEAKFLKAKRPEVFYGTFGELWTMAQECKHEGYMVRLPNGETVMKIKSPHYLTKKFLMRMGAKKVDQMFNDKSEFLKTIDEEFYHVVHYITRWHHVEGWTAKTDAERRAVIEMYFHEIVYDAKKGEY